jgi:hypothetical protein
MSELGCNVVAYHPDPEILAAKFRPWHVEALLQQAAVLIKSCQRDYKEYCTLDYAWNRFRTDLEIQERQLEFEKQGVAAEGSAATSVTLQQPEDLSEQTQESPEESESETEERGEIAEEPAVTGAPAVLQSGLELRAAAIRRKHELSAPGGPFALDERRDLALKRLCRDYEEAVNRACVAEAGLSAFYDHAEAASPLPTASEALGSSITNLSIWINNASEWLAQTEQLEEKFTKAISVRSLLSRSAWMQLRQARDSFLIKLQIPANYFRDHDNCLLRGVSASLVGEAGTVPWSMILRLPEDAVYKRGDDWVDVDQSNRPSCFFGCLENRRSVRPLETCGIGSWINASPIGRSNPRGLWSLEIFKPLGVTSESFGQVDDLVLEIHAVGRTQQPKS